MNTKESYVAIIVGTNRSDDPHNWSASLLDRSSINHSRCVHVDPIRLILDTYDDTDIILVRIRPTTSALTIRAHEVRMFKELNGLSEKAEKLQSFLLSATRPALSNEELLLMTQQLEGMLSYRSALRKRLSAAIPELSGMKLLTEVNP